MKTMEAVKVQSAVAERSKSAIKKLVTIEEMKVGQWVRHGDVYIRRIEKCTGTVELKSRQLAPGNSVGSRHIVEDKPTVRILDGYCGKEIPNFIKGCQIEAKERFIITHPKHAHYSMPVGDYQTTFQMDFKRMARNED